MRRHILVALMILTLGVAGGCASGGSGGVRAGDEMKEGYRAARRGYWQEALLRFERARELRPDEVRVLNNLAVALEAVGRYDEAGKVYDEARQIAPNDGKLRKNYRLYKEFYETYLADGESTETPAEGDDSNA